MNWQGFGSPLELKGSIRNLKKRVLNLDVEEDGQLTVVQITTSPFIHLTPVKETKLAMIDNLHASLMRWQSAFESNSAFLICPVRMDVKNSTVDVLLVSASGTTTGNGTQNMPRVGRVHPSASFNSGKCNATRCEWLLS